MIQLENNQVAPDSERKSKAICKIVRFGVLMQGGRTLSSDLVRPSPSED
jgi:hypothetical protein